MNNKLYVLLLTVICLGIVPHVNGQDAENPLTEAQKSVKRLAFLKKAIARFEIRQTGQESTVAKPLAEPVLRWINPLSGSRDGILSVFVADGRPVAMGQLAIYGGGGAIHEFHVTSDGPFELRRGKSVLWKSPRKTISFSRLETRPPVKSKPQLLTQMRRIAAEFELWDDHGWKKTVRQQLRLLPQPVYRYTDKPNHVTDASVFVFALANDPEAVLLLEACESEGEGYWQYTFSPVTIYALEARRDGQTVWQAPERRGYKTQFVGDYRMAPDDPPLRPLLPSGK